MQIGTLPHGMALRIVLQQCDHGLRDGIRSLEWNDDTSFFGQQFLGVPVGRGYDRLACPEGNSERSGNNLRLLLVWSDVDIRGPYMFHQFLGTYKAVVENQVIADSKLRG